MLIRCLFFATLATALPLNTCDNLMVGDASVPSRASQRYIESLIGPVKARFAAVTAASKCRQEDNRFSYDMLLSRLNGAGQAILQRAASEGVEEGRSVSADSPVADSSKCKAAIDRLKAADDQLLVLSERLSG